MPVISIICKKRAKFIMFQPAKGPMQTKPYLFDLERKLIFMDPQTIIKGPQKANKCLISWSDVFSKVLS